MDDYYFYIFISIVLLITILSYSVETFKEHLDYGNYTREQTLGTFVPNNQKENINKELTKTAIYIRILSNKSINTNHAQGTIHYQFLNQ